MQIRIVLEVIVPDDADDAELTNLKGYISRDLAAQELTVISADVIVHNKGVIL